MRVEKKKKKRRGRSLVNASQVSTVVCVCVCARITFVLVGAASSCVAEDGEVGGRNGVGAATAVAMVTTQTTPRWSLRVDAAGAAASLWGDGWGCAVPVWNILWLSNNNNTAGSTHNL